MSTPSPETRSNVSAPPSENSDAGDSTDPEGGELPRDEIFHLLSNDRRRYLLHCLMQAEGDSVSLREASRMVAAWENNVPATEVESQMRRRVYIALQQTHLPTLDDRGVVEYSETGSEIELSDRIDDLRVYLENKRDIPWSEFYLGMGALLAALTALFWIDLPFFAAVPDIAWAAIVAGIFTATAAVHVYIDERMRLGGEGPPPSVKNEG